MDRPAIAIVCPLCGCEEVHIGSVVVDQGTVLSIIDRSGATDEKRSKVPNNRRGSIVAISMQCEQGCDFITAFEFHKGTTFLAVSRPAIGEEFSELFRD